MKRLLWTVLALIVGNILGGFAVERLRSQLIQARTHTSANALEPWEETIAERLLLKAFVFLAWWRIIYRGRRQHLGLRDILIDIRQGMMDPIRSDKFGKLLYAGL